MHEKPVAEVLFVGGIMRSVYVDEDGRQCVLDDDGQRVYGCGFIRIGGRSRMWW